MSQRNHSLPTFRCSSSTGVDLQRASTGRGRRHHERQTELTAWSAVERRQSMETAITELSCDDASEADGCCNACASSLRRSHRVSSQLADDGHMLFNSSRELLILEPTDSSVTVPRSQAAQTGVTLPWYADCTDTTCRCHSGVVNLTFVSDDTSLRCNAGYTITQSDHSHDHVSAAAALMQPVDGQTTVMASVDGQTMPESSIEMLCYSVCRSGSRLVVEDLEGSGRGVVSSDVTSVQTNDTSHWPVSVREAWPDWNHVPAAGPDRSQVPAVSPDSNHIPAVRFNRSQVPAVSRDSNHVPAVRDETNHIPAAGNDRNHVPAAGHLNDVTDQKQLSVCIVGSMVCGTEELIIVHNIAFHACISVLLL